jgi:hypothetical protein
VECRGRRPPSRAHPGRRNHQMTSGCHSWNSLSINAKAQMTIVSTSTIWGNSDEFAEDSVQVGQYACR